MLSANSHDIIALCVLASLAACLAGWIVLKLRRWPFSPVQSALYALNYAVTRILWRAEVHGRFPIALVRAR